MLSIIRRRVTYANVAMTLALVFAMSGGAFAASKYLITSTKQIKPSVLKSLKGKAGPGGPAGLAGAAGPAGPQGLAGANGKDGANGTNGSNGTNGTSVTSSESANAIEGHCNGTTSGKGGSKFESASGKTYACNGKEGSPWTAGGVLPQASTETGSFSLPSSEFSAEPTPHEPGRYISVPISFPIRLASELEGNHTEVVQPGTTGANCTGTPTNPTAPSGFLCVYMALEEETATKAAYEIRKSGGPFYEGGASTAGAVLWVSMPESNGLLRQLFVGTWAVTG